MISGNSTPIVGEKNTYHIAGCYADTPQVERNPAMVTWELFKKRSNGKFTSTNIKKTGDGTFTFGEMSIRNTYRLEAYLYRPEGGGLIINPKPSAIPKIGKVELHYVDDKKSHTFSFYDRLRAKAHTTGMLQKELIFILWEDDSKGGGHSAGNQPIEVKSARVQHNGLAIVEFTLTKGLMQKAMKGEADAKEFEFYVTVEYYKGKIHDSKNVNVHNPFHKAPEKKESHPKAPGSPAEQKPPSKREEKNLLIHQADGYLLHDWAEVKGKAQKNKEVTVNRKHGRSTVGVKSQKAITNNCGEKYCIKKGDKSELIREINIRLAGFGGNVPTDEFTDRTERMIKQFQKDYMKVPETGRVCGDVLRAIDEFSNRYPINIDGGKCPCKECTGFGNGLYPEQKNNIEILEKNRRYEYPGIHRSLLWVEKAIKFYLANHEKHLNLIVGLIFSGYRCNANNRKNSRSSTNHMGKALDLHIYKVDNKINTENNADKVRDILLKYTNAEYRWKGCNVFALEPSTKNRIGNEFIATTWVHYDVRTFDLKYLKDEYFAKDNKGLNGESIVALANKLGYQNVCSCYIGKINSNRIEEKKFGTESRVNPKTLKASDKIVEFIKDWEKKYSKMPYNDKKGYCTIGYGHLIKKKRCEDIVIPAEFKNGLSEKDATTIFKEDLKEFEIAIQRDVTVKLYQREFDALIDLLFNCGPNFLRNGKAPKLYDSLLNEKYEDAAKEFLDIENKKRRQQNYEIFINGNYDSTH